VSWLSHFYNQHQEEFHGLGLLAYVELRQWMVQNEKKFLDLALAIPVAILNRLKKRADTMPAQKKEQV